MAVQVRSARAACVACLIYGICAGYVHAQALTRWEFSFSTPGARSLGFGGAFVVPADDATYLRAILPAGDNEMHFIGGVGVALEKLQIDLGVDPSQRIDTVSLSAIYSS